eukprot:TRINITY_DN1959_c0_g2_i1.p1 TRINITY_DN1959_c0_g2~~TRINITY_DN1959_c0_g2_i1.p1  ORF type:complete len:165 (+),score=14.94 TRINITY_DN1959_c0_g2_i1:452-946(+)
MRMQLTGPALSKPPQTEPTTKDVNFYTGEINHRNIILLDFEGTDSIMTQGEISSQRQEFISKELPQLAYLLSNIVIYVDKVEVHNTTYVKRLMELAERSRHETASRTQRAMKILKLTFVFLKAPNNFSVLRITYLYSLRLKKYSLSLFLRVTHTRLSIQNRFHG